MAQTDTTLTRSALRDEIRRDLYDELNQRYRPLLGLVVDQDGANGHTEPADEAEMNQAIVAGVREMPELKVVTRRDVAEAIAAVFEVPLPPPPNHHAEVGMDNGKATVTVAVVCPECEIAHPIVVTITPELLVDPDGKELRVKTKAKGRVHVCGQLPLAEATEPAVDGQLGAFDGVDEEADEEADEEDEQEVVGEEASTGPEQFDADEELPDPSVLRCMGSNHVPGCEHMGGQVPPARPAVSIELCLADYDDGDGPSTCSRVAGHEGDHDNLPPF